MRNIDNNGMPLCPRSPGKVIWVVSTQRAQGGDDLDYKQSGDRSVRAIRRTLKRKEK